MPTQLILLAGNVPRFRVSPRNDLNSNKNFPHNCNFGIRQPSRTPTRLRSRLMAQPPTSLSTASTSRFPLRRAPGIQGGDEFRGGSDRAACRGFEVSVVTRSGTNSWHGNAFDYVRNYEFNARNATALVRDSLKQNQFGGTFGGPIKKNKLFFFVGEQSTMRAPTPRRTSVYSMTPAMLAWRLHGRLRQPNTAARPRRPSLIQNEAGNWWEIPSAPSLMNPIALKIAKYLPPSSVLANPCGEFFYAKAARMTDSIRFPSKSTTSSSQKEQCFCALSAIE